MEGISYTLYDMQTTTETIAAKVRGVAAEKRYTQKRIADTLSISRTSVVERINGRIPFTATEILDLARSMRVSPSRFFPDEAELMAADEVAA